MSNFDGEKPVVLVIGRDKQLADLNVAAIERGGYSALQMGDKTYVLDEVARVKHFEIVAIDVKSFENHVGAKLTLTIREKYPKAGIIITSEDIRLEPVLPAGAGFVCEPRRNERLVNAIREMLEKQAA
jgi:hypothetical protein